VKYYFFLLFILKILKCPVFICVLLIGCSAPLQNKLIGTWIRIDSGIEEINMVINDKSRRVLYAKDVF